MRNLLAQCCCAAGGLAGLWLGFLAAPKEAGSAHVLRALAEVLVPVAWHVGIGVLAGVLVAWMLIVTVAGLQRRVSQWAVKDSNLQPWD